MSELCEVIKQRNNFFIFFIFSLGIPLINIFKEIYITVEVCSVFEFFSIMNTRIPFFSHKFIEGCRKRVHCICLESYIIYLKIPAFAFFISDGLKYFVIHLVNDRTTITVMFYSFVYLKKNSITKPVFYIGNFRFIFFIVSQFFKG